MHISLESSKVILAQEMSVHQSSSPVHSTSPVQSSLPWERGYEGQAWFIMRLNCIPKPVWHIKMLHFHFDMQPNQLLLFSLQVSLGQIYHTIIILCI